MTSGNDDGAAADPAVRERVKKHVLELGPSLTFRILSRAREHQYLGVRIAAYELQEKSMGEPGPKFDPWAAKAPGPASKPE